MQLSSQLRTASFLEVRVLGSRYVSNSLSRGVYFVLKLSTGDVEHTHLVKGLDLALLNKVRSEIDKKADAEDDSGKTRYDFE